MNEYSVKRGMKIMRKSGRKYYSWARTRGLALLYFFLADLVVLLILVVILESGMAVQLWFAVHVGGLLIGVIARGIVLFEEL